MAMHYNRNLIMASWLPLMVFDIMGIYYLTIDNHVCPTSPLWIWSIVTLVFQMFFFYLIALCAMINYSFEYYKLYMTIGGTAINATLSTIGGIILYSTSPSYTCTHLKVTGLYVWSNLAFSLVSAATVYYAVNAITEFGAIRLDKKLKTATESDYLLAQVANGDPLADPEARNPIQEGEGEREPTLCHRPGCEEYGTTLCATCKQVSYCSSACLFAHHKTTHKFECAKLMSEGAGGKDNTRLLGTVRPGSYVPHDSLNDGRASTKY